MLPKKLNFLQILLGGALFIFAFMAKNANAQCTITTSNANNIVINEISGDPAQSDGANDGLIELSGQPGSPIGCWLISNGEWAVMIPPGTAMPADGVFVIGCGSSSQYSGVGTTSAFPGGPVSGLTCAICDFPGLSLDFDLCATTNTLPQVGGGSFTINTAGYYDPGASGFTIDNASPTDGDQIVLFKPDGTPWDLVILGAPASFASADNVDMANGLSYTLGTVSVAGNNDVRVVPFGAGNPIARQCSGSTFTMPPTSDPRYITVGTTQTGCGSTNIRNNTTAAATWDCNTFIASGAGSPAAAQAQWSTIQESHPTPGLPNNSTKYTWTLPTQNIYCTPTALTFQVDIFNYQIVQPNVVSPVSGKSGSYIQIPTGITGAGFNAWTLTNMGGGTTRLTYTIPAASIPATGGTYTLNMQWADNNNTLGTTGNAGAPQSTVTMGNSGECNEQNTFVFTVVAPMTASKTTLSCPTDFPAGTVNIASIISGGLNKTYQLKNNGVNVGTANTTGVFNLPTSLAGPLTVVVTDASACTAPITVSINNNCRAAPICPTSLNYDACTTTAGAKCPNDVLNFALTATGLPTTGLIEWVNDSNNNGNVYDEPASSVLTTQTLTGIPIETATVCGDINSGAIAFTSLNANSTTESFSFITLETLTAGLVVNFTDNAWTGSALASTEGILAWTVPAAGVPAGTTVIFSSNSSQSWSAANGTIQIGAAAATSFTSSGVASTGSFSLVNSGDNIFAYCGTAASPNFISLVATGGIITTGSTTSSSTYLPSALAIGTNAVQPGAASTPQTTASAGNYAYNCTGSPIIPTSFLTNVYNRTNWSGTAATSTTAAVAVSACTIVYGTVSPACAAYTIPASACGTTISVKPRISPLDASCGPVFATLATRNFTISCPTATLTGGGQACATPGFVPLTIMFTNVTGSPTYTINYKKDGVAQAAITTTASPYTLNATTTGTYSLASVTATGANCTFTATGSANVVVSPAVTAALASATSPATCSAAGSLSFNFAGTAPWDFSYQNTTTGTVFTGTAGSSPFTVTGLAAGAYNLLNVRDDNTCTGSVSGTATINPPPASPTLSGSACATVPTTGDVTLANPSVTNPGTGGSFTWYISDPSDPSFPSDPAVRATYLVNDADAGVANTQVAPSSGLPNTYYVLYENAANCMVSTAQTVMSRYAVTPTNPTCTSVAASNIQFSLPTAIDPLLAGPSPNNSFISYDFVAASSYTGSATAATATSALGAITIPQTALPSFPAAGASQDYTFRFFDKSTGCFYDKTVTISRPTTPTLTTANVSPACGTNTTALSAGVTGGTAVASTDFYSENTFTTAASSPTSTAGTYFVKVSSADGCTATSSFDVAFRSFPTANIATISGGCITSPMQLDASSSSGTGVLSFAWTTTNGTIDSGASTATPTVSNAGTYEVSVTQNGCASTQSVTIACTLPVKLISFEGKISEKDNILFWQTATEQNTNFFEIQRSYDGINFDAIGKVSATGNSNIIQNYNFTDKNVSASTYYRLHIVDFDGKFENSNTVYLNRSSKDNSIKGISNINLFPNPTNGAFEVSYENNNAETIIFELTNHIGQRIFTSKKTQTQGLQTVQFDLSAMPSGFYILAIDDTSGKRTVLRIVKQ